jgi:hypothetical protein
MLMQKASSIGSPRFAAGTDAVDKKTLRGIPRAPESLPPFV